jgi:hypothetical protein
MVPQDKRTAPAGPVRQGATILADVIRQHHPTGFRWNLCRQFAAVLLDPPVSPSLVQDWNRRLIRAGCDWPAIVDDAISRQ